MRLFVSSGAPVESHEKIPRNPKSMEVRHSRIHTWVSVSPMDDGLWEGRGVGRQAWVQTPTLAFMNSVASDKYLTSQSFGLFIYSKE